jgi:hypothetical protein
MAPGVDLLLEIGDLLLGDTDRVGAGDEAARRLFLVRRLQDCPVASSLRSVRNVGIEVELSRCSAVGSELLRGRPDKISLTSTSSGWLMANTTMIAKESAGIATLS